MTKEIKLREALEKLLKCPDLNLDNLEDETVAAIEFARGL